MGEVGTLADKHSHLRDWYYSYDKYEATDKEMEDHKKKLEKLEDWQRELLEYSDFAYVISVKNLGGMVMPLVLDIELKNGRERQIEVPVEIWRYGDEVVKIPFLSDREVVRVTLDKDNAFADSNLDNNVFPREIDEGRFKLKPRKKQPNPMRNALFPNGDNEKDGEEKED